MTTFKKAPQGIVAQGFAHNSISTAAVGDLVQVHDDMEVETCLTGRPIGEIVAKDANTGKVTVELFASKILSLLVGASSVTAGDHVKMSAKNTVITSGSVSNLDLGIALEGGSTGETIKVVPL